MAPLRPIRALPARASSFPAAPAASARRSCAHSQRSAPRSASSTSLGRRGRRLPRNLAAAGATVRFEPADVTDIAALRAGDRDDRQALGPDHCARQQCRQRHAPRLARRDAGKLRRSGSPSTSSISSSPSRRSRPSMIAAGGGSIINFGSIAWRIAHGRHARLRRLEGGGRGAHALLRARPRPAPHPRQLRAARLGDDRAAARAVGRRERRPHHRRAAVPAGPRPARRPSRAWCSSSPPTTAPCARRRTSSSTPAGFRARAGRHARARFESRGVARRSSGRRYWACPSARSAEGEPPHPPPAGARRP